MSLVQVWRMMAIGFKGSRFQRDAILRGIYRYAAYPSGCREVEERVQEQGIELGRSAVHHAGIGTLHRIRESQRRFTRALRPARQSRSLAG